MEDASSPIITNLIILVVVLSLAVIFTLLEYSIIRTRPGALKAMQDVREKPSKRISTAIHMTEHLTEYLSTAQVGITLTSLVTGWIGEVTLADILIKSGIFKAMGWGDAIAHTVASVAAILIFTFVHAVFTDLVPKNIAIAEPTKTLLAITPIVRFFHLGFWPLIVLFDRSAWAITHLFGIKQQDEADIYSQTEILDLTRTSAEAGELDEEDYEFMQRAFMLNNKDVADIMTDRTKIVAVDVEDSIADALQVYLTEHFSRIPVTADNDKDNIIGYVLSYDVVKQSRIDDTMKVAKIMRDNVAIPENTKITTALEEMDSKRAPIAVAVDEYGGTAGIITDKDVYEELFGNFRDEHDDADDQVIQKMGNGKYLVDGSVSVYDLEEYFDVTVPELEKDEAVTLAGFILNNYPDVKKGDEIQVSVFRFKVMDLEEAYIDKFEVEVLSPDEIANPDSETQEDSEEE